MRRQAAQGVRSPGNRPEGQRLLQDGHAGAGQAVQLGQVGRFQRLGLVSGSDTKTESSTKSSDSGSKAEPSKSGTNGDKAVKESKPAASAAT